MSCLGQQGKPAARPPTVLPVPHLLLSTFSPMNPLPTNLDPQRLPRHVAVIMDGNGRWAKQRGLPRIAGHRQGARMLKSLLRCCHDWGISALTAYAFSTENWQRPLAEVDFLMNLFERLLQQEMAELQRQGVRITFIGDLSALPGSLRRMMELAMGKTVHNRAIQFNVAVNYGSRAEMLRAIQTLVQKTEVGEITAADVNEDLVNQNLYTAHSPEPDFLIRTSGEMRLSNYLLWQLAYTELYFTDVLWPDFDTSAFHQALLAYQGRERRFGTTPAPYSVCSA
jgi:undecaprenyl diphosphate synthase